MAARKWTAEQRKQQSLKIMQWQPWTKSTGAKTAEGKTISAKNAYKGGLRRVLQELASYLREQQRQIEVSVSRSRKIDVDAGMLSD